MAVVIVNQPLDFIGAINQGFGFQVDAYSDADLQLVYLWQYSPNGTNWYDSTLPGYSTCYVHDTITSTRLSYLYRCRINETGSTNYTYTDLVRLIEGTTPPLLAQLNRLWGAKRDILTAISNKGVTVAWDTPLDGIPTLITSIP